MLILLFVDKPSSLLIQSIRYFFISNWGQRYMKNYIKQAFYNKKYTFEPKNLIFVVKSYIFILSLLYFLQFFLKPATIHFACYRQAEREGNPDAQYAHAARKTEGIAQWK